MIPRATILCFGDSNTHGSVPMADLASATRLPRAERWCSVLATELGPEYEVIAEGQPGRTTVHDDPIEGVHRNGQRALAVALECHAPIDLVVLMLGTNDLKARFGVGAFDVAMGIRRLAREIGASTAGPAGRAPALLIVAPPAPRGCGVLAEMFRGVETRAEGLAQHIRTVAAGCGAAFLDAGAVIAVSPLDGVHFDAPAHAALGSAIAEAAARILSSAPPTSQSRSG